MPTVLITGGHGGIGLECCKLLASQYRMNLILAGRSLDRVEPVARDLANTYGVKVDTLELDTSSLSSVRAAAAICRSRLDNGRLDTLHAVICNAGVRLNGPVNYSRDGYEETFATNCLGHFLLIELLIDCIAGDGRVVFTTSGTHDPDTVDGRMVGAAVEPNAVALANDGKRGGTPLPSGVRYSTSKLCIVLFAYELERRLKRAGSGIVSIAFDPGSTPGTGFLRSMPKPIQWIGGSALMPWLMRRVGVTIGSLEFSGAALGKLAADEAYADGAGKYFQSNDGRLIETHSSKVSYDEGRARKLWEDCKILVHLDETEEPVVLKSRAEIPTIQSALARGSE